MCGGGTRGRGRGVVGWLLPFVNETERGGGMSGVIGM